MLIADPDLSADEARVRIGVDAPDVRRALQVATERVVMLLPAKWLALGKRRSRLVRHDHPPQFVLHFTEINRLLGVG